jgi:hypothetical protein
MVPVGRVLLSACLGFYARDTVLFAQRMHYSKDGLSWMGTPCCYYGDPSEHEEHVFPVSALTKLLAAGDVSINRDVLRIVPACAECNLLAGDKVFWTF